MKRQWFLLFSAVLALFLIMNVSAEAGKGHPEQFPQYGYAAYSNSNCFIEVDAMGSYNTSAGVGNDDYAEVGIYDPTSMKSTSKSITMSQNGYLVIYIEPEGGDWHYVNIPVSSMSVSANPKKGSASISFTDASLHDAANNYESPDSHTFTYDDLITRLRAGLPWLKLKNGTWKGSCSANIVN